MTGKTTTPEPAPDKGEPGCEYPGCERPGILLHGVGTDDNGVFEARTCAMHDRLALVALLDANAATDDDAVRLTGKTTSPEPAPDEPGCYYRGCEQPNLVGIAVLTADNRDFFMRACAVHQWLAFEALLDEILDGDVRLTGETTTPEPTPDEGEPGCDYPGCERPGFLVHRVGPDANGVFEARICSMHALVEVCAADLARKGCGFPGCNRPGSIVRTSRVEGSVFDVRVCASHYQLAFVFLRAAIADGFLGAPARAQEALRGDKPSTRKTTTAPPCDYPGCDYRGTSVQSVRTADNGTVEVRMCAMHDRRVVGAVLAASNAIAFGGAARAQEALRGDKPLTRGTTAPEPGCDYRDCKRPGSIHIVRTGNGAYDVRVCTFHGQPAFVVLLDAVAAGASVAGRPGA